MKKAIVLIKAPTILGLRPSGVEEMPDAIEKAGLTQILHIHDVRTVTPLKYDPVRDVKTQMLNPDGIATYSVSLANYVQAVLNENKFPIVLGGDCSIILGN